MSIIVKCTFKDGEGKQYPNLLKLGEQIVKKCGGVPLAVRSLRSLLNTKKDECDWMSIRESGIWKLEQDQDGIMVALRLRYYDLPHHLKQCLALCSFFPKIAKLVIETLSTFGWHKVSFNHGVKMQQWKIFVRHILMNYCRDLSYKMLRK